MIRLSEMGPTECAYSNQPAHLHMLCRAHTFYILCSVELICGKSIYIDSDQSAQMHRLIKVLHVF